MSLLDSQPDTETSREDLLTILVAIVRAYGSQEVSYKASRVIIDEHELVSAYEVVSRGQFQIYKMDHGVKTTLDGDRNLEQNVTRYVIEVR